MLYVAVSGTMNVITGVVFFYLVILNLPATVLMTMVLLRIIALVSAFYYSFPKLNYIETHPSHNGELILALGTIIAHSGNDMNSKYCIWQLI